MFNSKNEEMIGQKLILKDNGDLMGDISDESLINDVRENFNGETIIAQDLMIIE